MNLFGVAIVCCALLGWAKFECSATHYESCDSARLMRDCGWRGMTRKQCLDMGCCYKASNVNPWCTYSKGPQTFCNYNQPRVNCGWHDISRQACERRGCCYSTSYTGPRCFYKGFIDGSRYHVCAAHSSSKTDCGRAGMTPKDCVETLGCCYAPSDTDYWCYHSISMHAN